MSGHPDLERALAPLVDALERLGIPYRIGGSIASSLHGVARATLDVDIVVHMPVDAAGSSIGSIWCAGRRNSIWRSCSAGPKRTLPAEPARTNADRRYSFTSGVG
ncbi:MAG: hypothetical protein ABFS86_04530 [Planctomycetota bacterium]